MLVRAVAEHLRTVVSADGRTVAFATWGDPDGFPILALHGTPGSRLERWAREGLYRELGVYLVTHDRAGYARSDRRRGRRVADEVDDVLLLADELGFDRFAVPVLVRYGASDVLVPAAHGAWLGAHVPGCVVKIDDTAGHLGEEPEREIAENVAWLRDGIAPPGSVQH